MPWLSFSHPLRGLWPPSVGGADIWSAGLDCHQFITAGSRRRCRFAGRSARRRRHRRGHAPLATDETLRRELIRKGLENVKRFSWDNRARETLAVLEEAGGSNDHTLDQPDPRRRPFFRERTGSGRWPDSGRQVRILGVRIDALTYPLLLECIASMIATARPAPDCHRQSGVRALAQRNPEFRVGCRGGNLCMADGVGLLWAARRLGHPLPERVTGSDSVPMIAARVVARAGWRLYLLGAAPGVAERTATILTAQNPGLQIAGTYAGSPAESEAQDIIARIRVARADLLFVAYGPPAQDLWIARHREELGVPVMMGVGGTFDHIAGVKRRAPLWLQRLGLEWLFRLITQPSRWRRQLTLPQFVWRVLRSRPDSGTP